LFETIDQPQRQVLIEATIVEVGLTENNQFGVQWDFIANQLRATFSELTSGAVTSLFPGGSVSFVNSDITAVVNALALTSDVEIVSSPRILVLNNETARLQIGDQVPIITQSAVSVTDPGAPIVNSTTYRDTGVILIVTPSIRAGGMVEIEISQEVSGVAETTTSTIDSPTISQRSIESRLAVPDGSTAVLGGLMSSNRSFSETGIPVLKDVPLVGNAFRSTGTTERRTELVILVEPTVVLSAEPSVDIPLRLRDALLDARRGAE
jgi:general secretion pathway protein D